MKGSILLAILLIGQIFAQLPNINRSYPYVDVVYIIDENAMTRNDLINFLNNFMPRAESSSSGRFRA
jgi:hypothetical protein